MGVAAPGPPSSRQSATPLPPSKVSETVMTQPLWMRHAWELLGEREVPGRRDNARILALYRDAGHPEIRHDETAWCAAFAGACLVRAGEKATGSLMARSYLDWGEPCEEAQAGAIAVLSRGSDPALGHVGFLVGETDEHVVLLGGNQGDAVCVEAFPRARLLGLRWPAESHAVKKEASPGLPDRKAEERGFAAALAHVLEMEGGYTDDPFDPGGPTNRGITLRVYAAWCGVSLDATSAGRLKEQLRHISADVVHDIYRARYWRPACCSELPAGLAFMHFDAAVNHGVGTAARCLQEALGVDIDGEIGPLTRAAATTCNPGSALERYAEIRRRRYRALRHFWRFGRGWLRRVDLTLARALAIPGGGEGAAPISTQQKGRNDMSNEKQGATTAKWWGESLSVWGTLITAMATVLPALGPVIGIDLTPELVKDAGQQIISTVQAVAGLVGTIMAIYGRARATQPLERRPMSLRL